MNATHDTYINISDIALQENHFNLRVLNSVALIQGQGSSRHGSERLSESEKYKTSTANTSSFDSKPFHFMKFL